MLLFLRACIVGIINSLPTGPAGAFLLAKRANNSKKTTLALLIVSILCSDTILLFVIAKSSEKFTQLLTFHILSGALSFILIAIGAHMIYSTRHVHRKHEEASTLSTISDSVFSFLWMLILNLVNPIAVVTTAAFLKAFYLLPIDRHTFGIVLAGYLFTAAIMWITYVVIINKYWHLAEHYTRTILKICGSVLIVFGFSYVAHQAVVILQRVIMWRPYL